VEYDTVWSCGSIPTFQKNLLPPKSVTGQKTLIFIVTAMERSSLTVSVRFMYHYVVTVFGSLIRITLSGRFIVFSFSHRIKRSALFVHLLCSIFDVHMSVHRKYISKVQPTRCNVFSIYLFL